LIIVNHVIHINAHVIFPHRVGQRTLLEEPFTKWGLDVFGQIKLVGQLTRNWYIFVIINYATKWVEVKAFFLNTTTTTTKFQFEYICV
jgi:hypothetical protein